MPLTLLIFANLFHNEHFIKINSRRWIIVKAVVCFFSHHVISTLHLQVATARLSSLGSVLELGNQSFVLGKDALLFYFHIEVKHVPAVVAQSNKGCMMYGIKLCVGVVNRRSF